MHSRIFQIGLEPIAKDDYVSPSYFDDDCLDFADYIGDELEGTHRVESIEWLVKGLRGILGHVSDGVLRYNGLGNLLEEWAAEVKRQAGEISGENIIKDMRRYRMSALMDRTHLDLDFRFYTEDWSGCAEPLGDFVAYLSTLEEGTLIYVGSVIDFHF